MNPKQRLRHGNRFPFDAPNRWWHSGATESNPPPPKDWAHSAARGVIADLQDRRGIKNELGMEMDEEIRAEIVESLAAIIREARS